MKSKCLFVILISTQLFALSCKKEAEPAIVGCTVISIGRSDHAWSGSDIKRYQRIEADVFNDEYGNCDDRITVFFELVNDRNAPYFDKVKKEIASSIMRVGSKMYLGGKVKNGKYFYPDMHIESVEIIY